jgi:hypothetical protein
MPRGPLPDPNKLRRNAPTVPTTSLPADGRATPTPEPPRSVDLGPAGADWWEWAWHTPQAAAWDDGTLYTVARRASLEDDLAACANVESLDLPDNAPEVRRLIQHLAGLATGRLNICREMREIDDRLGLTPKSLAQLRWKIDGAGPQKATGTAGRTRPRASGRLKVVEGGDS